MNDYQIGDLVLRLQRLEDKLQHGELTEKGIKQDNTELNNAVSELKDIVNSLDKRLAVHEEKYAHLTYQITKLEETIDALEGINDKEFDHKRDIVENIFMIVLGAVVTYVFSIFKP